jgi:hypothetical protein
MFPKSAERFLERNMLGERRVMFPKIAERFLERNMLGERSVMFPKNCAAVFAECALGRFPI